MLGPRPGDRVCKVNFSKLSDIEKTNTNQLLANQDHEIVFEECDDGFVANVKFIRGAYRSSPERHFRIPGSSSKNKKSPSPDTRQPASKPRATSKTQSRYLGNTSSSLKRAEGSLPSKKPRESSQGPPKGGISPSPSSEKLTLLAPYQQFFETTGLQDPAYRPILIGKSKSS